MLRRFLACTGLLLGLLLTGCGGGGDAAPSAGAPPDEGTQDACTVPRQRDALRSYMQDQYYFSTQAGDDSAASMDAYFQSLLMRPADRYSFSEPLTPQGLLGVLGRRIGYGYTLVWADSSQTVLKVRNVEPGSPAALAGLRRGDTVLAIDGESPARVAAGALPAVSTVGVAREFRTRDVTGREQVLTVASQEFALSTVPATRTFQASRSTPSGSQTVTVGYLAYQQFATYGYIELGDAVRAMSAAGVKELVLDLRYNNGGSVNLARDLASMVGGVHTRGQVFAELRYNSRHPEQNLPLRFLHQAETLPAAPIAGLSRVVVIASGNTASAAELLINGLKPFLPVVLVGETTFGKPYGFIARESCGITYNAVNFEAFNAEGVGGFTSGFAATCPAADDLDRQLGDPLEGRTRTALHYIATGSCPAALPQAALLRKAAAPAVFGETLPGGMVRD